LYVTLTLSLDIEIVTQKPELLFIEIQRTLHFIRKEKNKFLNISDVYVCYHILLLRADAVKKDKAKKIKVLYSHDAFNKI
jgi:hypothetical protein